MFHLYTKARLAAVTFGNHLLLLLDTQFDISSQILNKNIFLQSARQCTFISGTFVQHWLVRNSLGDSCLILIALYFTDKILVSEQTRRIIR